VQALQEIASGTVRVGVSWPRSARGAS